MSDYYDEGHSFRNETALAKFEIIDATMTQVEIDYFKERYNIDLLKCSPQIIQLLINFKNHGASAAIMNLLLSLGVEG